MTVSKHVGQGLRPTLFSDPNDFFAQHPQTAELLERAAAELLQAHRVGGTQVDERLAVAERYTVQANGLFCEFLGVDPLLVLPLVRLVVDALAHQHPVVAIEQRAVGP